MCITAPARVVGLDADGAIVEVAGARRRASTLVVPGVALGDWVMVGAGTILRRLEAREGRELAELITTAAAADDVRSAPPGGRR